MWNFLIFSSACLLLSLFYRIYFSDPISIIEYSKTDYDYIVVGAGTAGCVIASRLSESPEVSVLLVEAGGSFQWFSSIPLAAPLLQKTHSDWAYETETQRSSSRGLHNQKQFWPRGKGLGGSGQMNYLLHSFGIPEDYIDWPSGWSYEDLRPYFERVESTMNIFVASVAKELATAFFQSEVEVQKAHKNTSFLLAKNTLKNGARWSSYHAYLQRAWNRENLHILTNTLVTKVLFENLTAIAVQIKYENGATGLIKAQREIILCGGAVNTPQLLLLSGIGPSIELQKHKIPLILHVEQVGKNLYDHLNVPIYVNLRTPISVTLAKLKSLSEILKYFVFGSGLLASNAIAGTGTSGSSGILLFGMGSADENLLKDIANFHTTTFRRLFPSYADETREGFIYLVSCSKPRSRGNVTLRSTDSSDPPIIDPDYLANNYDIGCSHEAINLAMKTLKTKPFVDLGATPNVPYLEECGHWPQDYENREFTECLTRTVGLTSHHPGGTCKLGTKHDDAAVVDDHLRVIGINNLRIMDASVMPLPISGTPNSVVIAMAEKAADIIAAEN